MYLNVPVRLVATLILIGCQAPEPQTEAPESSPEQERAAIMSTLDAEVALVSSGDVSKASSIYSDNAIMNPPAHPPLVGVDSIKAFISGFLEGFDVRADHDTRSLILSDGHAYEYWSVDLRMTPKEGGDPITEQIDGVHVWEKSPDGQWRIVHDIWNSRSSAGQAE